MLWSYKISMKSYPIQLILKHEFNIHLLKTLLKNVCQLHQGIHEIIPIWKILFKEDQHLICDVTFWLQICFWCHLGG